MIEIGGLQFIYDVKSWPDYAVLQVEDPLSDGAAIERLLARQSAFLSPKDGAGSNVSLTQSRSPR
jgi:hypothetical protein